MKQCITIILLASILPAVATACDICGCGVGNNYIGILPQFHRHIFGLRYRYNSLYTHVGAGGEFSYLTTRETYNTVEAWGGWNINDKVRVMAAIPYGFNQRLNGGNTLSKNGLGDISLSGYYQLVNDKHTLTNNRLLVQSLWVGGGVKAATGKYNPKDKNTTTNNANLFQLGTGSTDFNLGAMYDVRLQDAGINMTANYKLNTTNKYGYQYGNKFTVNLQAYYKFRIGKKGMVAPNAGVQFETAAIDRDNDFRVTVSGGRLLLGTAGIEGSVGPVVIGANFQTPFSQNLANGIVKANDRVMVHVGIAL